jgi:hypothetical protein
MGAPAGLAAGPVPFFPCQMPGVGQGGLREIGEIAVYGTKKIF